MHSRDLARVALMVGVIAALGLVPAVSVAGLPAPVTAQTLGIMLAGALLGARRGFLAAAIFLLLVAVGLPLLPPAATRPQGGLAVFSSGSAGYLLAWPLGAFVTGWCTERVWDRYNVLYGSIANTLGGVLVIHAGGILVVPLVTGLTLAQALDKDLLFIPGDLIKAIVAAMIAVGVRRAYPLARPEPAGA